MESLSAFTLKANGTLFVLNTDVTISSKDNDIAIEKKYRGIWDTGASKTSIDKRVVKELNLKPVSIGTLKTANGEILVNIYYINIMLPNEVTITNILAPESILGEDIDILIGMDVIRFGDFSITNANGNTTFSFRIPSVSEIDYTK